MDNSGLQKKSNILLIIIAAVFCVLCPISITGLITFSALAENSKKNVSEYTTEVQKTESDKEEGTVNIIIDEKVLEETTVVVVADSTTSSNPTSVTQETTVPYSEKTGNYRVTPNSGLYIRNSPTKDASIIGDLDENDVVYVSKFYGDFAYIPLYKGWVFTKYLAATSSPVNVSGYSVGNYKVTVASLRVRTGPGTQYDTVTTISSGTVFVVSSVSRNWGYCSELKGYVKLTYCTRTDAPPSLYYSSTASGGDTPTYYYYYEGCGDICIKEPGYEEWFIGYAKNNLSDYTSYYIMHQSGNCKHPQCTKDPQGVYADGRGPDEEYETEIITTEYYEYPRQQTEEPGSSEEFDSWYDFRYYYDNDY